MYILRNIFLKKMIRWHTYDIQKEIGHMTNVCYNDIHFKKKLKKIKKCMSL